MPPDRMIIVMPIERQTLIEICRSTFIVLSIVRNRSVARVKSQHQQRQSQHRLESNDSCFDLLPVHATAFPDGRAALRMRSSLASWRVNSAVLQPSDKTTMRSAIAKISGSSDETMITPRPACGQFVDERVDLAFGIDVDSSGRLIKQEHPRLRGQPLGEHDLLLIAPAEVAHGLAKRRSFNRKSRGILVGKLLLFAGNQEIPNSRFSRVTPCSHSPPRSRGAQVLRVCGPQELAPILL